MRMQSLMKIAKTAALGLLLLVAVTLGAVKINRLLGRESSPGNRSVTVSELKLALDKGQRLILLDVDDRPKYAKGHIPGAKNIPLDELEVRGPNELNLSDPVVIYCRCRNDELSDAASEGLKQVGFSNVRVLEGGFMRWEEDGQPVATK